MTAMIFARLAGLGLLPALVMAQSVAVQLIPHAEAVGGSRVISFGVPLPPALLADAAQVRMRDGSGSEIPAFVKPLGTWRSVPLNSFLCSPVPTGAQPGLRGVLVQFSMTFSSTAPVAVTVDFNTARTLHRPTETPVRDTWRTVREGTYQESAGIREPLVYATFPASWLACSGLDTLASQAGAAAFLGVFDSSQAGFFRHAINDFNPYPDPRQLINYAGDYEPWLYDRSQTFFNAYIRTGNADFLREGHRAAQHYLTQLYRAGECPGIADLDCAGFFRLKNPIAEATGKDAKYSYAESLLTGYWLTGDQETFARIASIRSATTRDFKPTVAVTAASAGAFTERNFGFALLAAVMEYEAGGSAEASAQAGQILNVLQAMQQAPVNGQEANGCLLYRPEEVSSEWGFSPWMSSILGHALARSYHTLGDERARQILVSLADCVSRRGVYYDGARWTTYYLSTASGVPWELSRTPSSSGAEHALDVGYLAAMGSYFSTDPAQSGFLLATAQRLWETHTNYIVPLYRASSAAEGLGLPEYRVSPPRKYNWWYKNSGSAGTVLERAGAGLAAVGTTGGPFATPGIGLGVEVRLRSAVPSGSTTVLLESSDSALLPVPSSVVIPAASWATRITVIPGSSAVRQTVRLTARLGADSVYADVVISPPALLMISANPYETGGGRTTLGNKITLTGPAAAGGVSVALGSTDLAVAAPDPVAVVPAGSSTATFPVSIPDRGTAATVHLTGSLGTESVTAPLAVFPGRLSSVSVPAYLTNGAAYSSLAVNLNTVAPAGGALIELGTDRPDLITIPSSVLIAAGQMSRTFTGTAAAGGAATVRLSAQYQGRTASGSFPVGPPFLTQVQLTPATLTAGSASSTSSVQINAPAPTGGVSVRLTSLAPETVSVPSAVAIPAGATTAAFPLTTSPVMETRRVTVTADLNGSVRGDSITVQSTGVPPIRVVLAASAVAAGSSLAGNQVILANAAPPGGAVVLLASGNPGLISVPASVTVAQGAQTALFSIQASPTSETASVTISATWQGNTAQAGVTVTGRLLSAVELSAALISGGRVLSNNRVVLDVPAPVSGSIVALRSSNPAIAQVPSSVAVPPGSTVSAVFDIVTQPVSQLTEILLTAELGAESRTAGLSVRPPVPTSLALPSSLVSGKSGTGTVNLDTRAPAGGVLVSLANSHPGVLQAPLQTLVPSNSQVGSFSISASPVAAQVIVNMSAASSGITVSDTTSIVPPALSSLTISPSVLGAGASSVLNKVNLTGVAAVPILVGMSAVPAGAVQLPTSVTVPAGASSANFTITANGVAEAVSTTISGTYGAMTKTKSLTVNPLSLVSLTLSPASSIGGKTTTANKVTLNTAAPAGGILVNLSTSNSGVASPPPSVAVAAGQTTATFAIALSAVASSTSAAITARLGDVARTAEIAVLPPALSTLTLSPASTVGSRTTTSNRVQLTGAAPAGNTVVSLVSSAPSVAAVPSTVTVPAGATYVNFPVTTSYVAAQAAPSIQATLSGITKTAALTVTPVGVGTVILSPATVKGGITTTTNRVSLNETAPPGGVTVALSSQTPAVASVPASVMVPAGATYTTFPIAIQTVGTTTAVAIQASAGGLQVSRVLTVTP